MLKLIVDNSDIDNFDIDREIGLLEQIIFYQRKIMPLFPHKIFNDDFSDGERKLIDEQVPFRLPNIHSILKEEEIYSVQFRRYEFFQAFKILSEKISSFLNNLAEKRGIPVNITNSKNLFNSLRESYINPNNFINDYKDISYFASQTYFNEKAACYWINMLSAQGNLLDHQDYLIKAKNYYDLSKNKEKIDFRELNSLRKKIKERQPLEFL